jgi:hypothetical protein
MDDIITDATFVPSHHYLTTYSLLFFSYRPNLTKELLIKYLTVHISTMKTLLFVFQLKFYKQ